MEGRGREQSQAGPARRFGLTSSSLWLRMPRTRSCRFLSNMRSMLPLTILRAIAAAAGRLEPREARGWVPCGGLGAVPAARGVLAAAEGRDPRPGPRRSARRRKRRRRRRAEPAGQAALPSPPAPPRLQMADKMAAGQLTALVPRRSALPEAPPPTKTRPLTPDITFP